MLSEHTCSEFAENNIVTLKVEFITHVARVYFVAHKYYSLPIYSFVIK